jgi:predicted RNA-binding protein with PIN domain
MKHATWPADVRRFRWIVDGHNAIFSHRDLEELQVGDRRREARRRLEEILERFAATYGVDVQIVYDGNRMERNPDARRGGRVESVYSLAPEEEADDRIVLIAARWIREGKAVVVVTSDRATLGARLPRQVVRVDPSELFRHLENPMEGASTREARPPGDFSDIEAHFLALEAEGKLRSGQGPRKQAPERRVRRPSQPPAARAKPAAYSSTPPAPTPKPAGPQPADQGREAKRARGLRAQRRRLEELRRKAGTKGRKGDR